MTEFTMCAACLTEHEDPNNRRFHAQPNACWDCGPQLELWDLRGSRVDAPDPVHETAQLLQKGRVVAIKGLGGFHLAVDATNASAVERLRQQKHRIEKPFALMVAHLDAAARLCIIDDIGRAALLGPERPIVLLPRKKRAPVAEAVAPNQSDFGIFLPYAPVHHLLFAAGSFSVLVMTSGNLSDEPIAVDNCEARVRLAGIADYFLVHNRDILLRCDDSVVRPCAKMVRQIRRSRGYVPAPLKLRRECPSVLAVGGEFKSTICLARGKAAFLSQHIGDLENTQSYEFFRETINHLSRLLEIKPEIIAHDLHPRYFSTQWAVSQKGIERVGVQHHHAHIASCMAENNIEGKVIGLALDGTGFGTDGNIWGGEALLADFVGFERAAHIAYVHMPGASAAIHEPWRMALSYLLQLFGPQVLDWDIPFIRRLDPRKAGTILHMIDRRVNSPLTSSCGRLFDAVAALIGLRGNVNYEAQAAMELEMWALKSSDNSAYPFDLYRLNGGWEIGTKSLFAAVVEELRKAVSLETISRRFHRGLVAVLVKLTTLLREQTSIDRVCLSGGVFHNSLVLESLLRDLEAAEVQVFSHARVPAGDGGLSLGQAVVAAQCGHVQRQ